MLDGKLKYDGGEVGLDGGVISTGRSSDNTIAFPSDSNVSRYHAEIEERQGEYWLIDLGSSNGTTLNGEKVERARKLRDGDEILLGGSSKISVELDEEFGQEEEGDDAEPGGGIPEIPMGSPGVGGSAFSGLGSGGSSGAAAGGGGAAAGSAGSGGGSMLLVAGVAGGIALVCVVAAGAFYMTRGSSCAAKATISKPEKGETISQPTDIEVNAEDAECVDHAVFTLDGTEIASAKEQPFTAKLNPNDFPELADGFEHHLQIILVDAKGQLIPQPDSVTLAFETAKVKKTDPTPEIAGTNTQQPTNKKGSAVTIVDIQEMSVRFSKQFPGGTNYNVTNRQFLAAVQKATTDYAQDGYYQRALAYRDAINVAYTQEQNLDAGLGFTLAMSRSKFNPAKQGSNEGLWQMSNDFVVANGYNGSCGTETLSDQSQNCAAKASAIYMKAIVFSVFDGDVIYSAAAFGKSPADAGAWKATLPANRSDVWNSIRTQQERDSLVKFFAAGIVAENPQKFGLTKDRPLSELYKVTL